MNEAMTRHIERLRGDIALSKWAGEALNDHYPGYPWAVHADYFGGVMTIKNLRAAGVYENYGYVIHPHLYASASELKKRIILAGGEILERAGLARGRETGQQVQHIEGVRPQDQPLLIG